MKAKGYFCLLSVVLLVALGFMTYFMLRQGFSWYLVLAESLTLLVLALLFVLYARAVKPLEIIGNGMDLLREQDFSSRLGYVGQKDADKVVDIFNKMMAQLKDERLRIREQNQFLDLLVNSSPMGVIILDFDEIINVINPAACQMMGVTADFAVGHPVNALGNGQLPQSLATIGRGESATIRTDDGRVFKCSCASFLDRGFHHTFYLVETMTEELLKAEKKAYDQVIRMMSHEVNNSMAGMASSLDTVREIICADTVDSTLHAEDKSDVQSLLSICAERCISLSSFISAFANVVKIPEPNVESVRLNDFISNRLRFFESLCSHKKITFETQLSAEVGTIRIDPILMEQVVVNIVKNAAEAIQEVGTISIETGVSAALERQPATTYLIISDNGKGISADAAGKLFTPFFSTKPNGQGIGLTIVRDILLKHHCGFSLRTGTDGRTRFSIFFSNICG